MTEEARVGATVLNSAQRSRVRVDWRTGRSMVEYDDAFWQEHERRRLEDRVPRSGVTL